MQSFFKRLWVRARQALSLLFVAREDESVTEVVAVLREVDLFRTLTRRQLARIAPAFHRRHYKRDEVVYYEGDPGLGLYVIEDGEVALGKDGNLSSDDNATVGKHHIFGVISMFGDIRREETARATTQTALLGLFSPELKALVRRHPSVGSAVLFVLARHLAELHVTGADEFQNQILALQSQLAEHVEIDSSDSDA